MLSNRKSAIAVLLIAIVGVAMVAVYLSGQQINKTENNPALNNGVTLSNSNSPSPIDTSTTPPTGTPPTAMVITTATPTPSTGTVTTQSNSSYYLQYQGTESKIYVVSASAQNGYYPYPTVTVPPFLNWNESIIAENGEPCVIITVTLRNDYSTQNPAPNPVDHSNLVHVGLTAQLSDGQNQITAKDITNANCIASFANNEATASMNYGDSATVTIYLATNSTNVASFQLQATYIGILIPP